jgi:hypothetical protein
MTASSGETRTAISGANGSFRFADVAADETCIFTASAKRSALSQPAQVRSILNDADDINFVGNSSSLRD